MEWREDNTFKLFVVCGHPNAEIGNREDENQVSKTSSSCFRVKAPGDSLWMFTALSSASCKDFATIHRSYVCYTIAVNYWYLQDFHLQ
jgi:hypothetical protein